MRKRDRFSAGLALHKKQKNTKSIILANFNGAFYKVWPVEGQV